MNLIEKFKTELKKIKTPKPYSDKTIDNYCEDVRQLLKYTQKPLESVTEKEIDAFLDENSAATSRRRYSGLRKFYEMLVADNIITVNPVRKRNNNELRQDPERITERLTLYESYKLLEEAKKNVRKFAIITTFLYTGIREDEFCRLTKKDYIFDCDINGNVIRTLRVLGKGNKERKITLNANVVSAIDAYLVTRKDEEPYLFISNSKKKYTGAAVYGLIKRTAEKAGIEKDIHPHCLRHTFTSVAWEQGADPVQLMYILGHTDIRTTMRYLGALGLHKSKEITDRISFNVKFE